MTWKRCANGAKYILATWSVIDGPDILEAGDSVEDLCKLIPHYLVEEEGEELYVCEVDHWTANNGEWWGYLDAEPHGFTTIFYVAPQNAELLVEEEEVVA